MLNLQLARKYSKAMFELAQEEGKLIPFGDELASVKKDLASALNLATSSDGRRQKVKL